MPKSLKLRNDRVLIVPGIPNQRTSRCRRTPHQVRRPGIRRGPRQRATAGKVQAVGLVHVGLIVRPPAIQVVQVEARCPKINQRIRVILLLQATRRVKRQIMIDKLPEIRESGRNAALLVVRAILGVVDIRR